MLIDITLESIRTLIFLCLVAWLWRQGKERFTYAHSGWNMILIGFSLLLFGSILDITDNFSSLNYLVVVGDTEVEAFLEKFVGNLGGLVLLTYGLFLWIPSVQKLSKEIEERKLAEHKLQKAKKAAELASQAKSDFLSHMSHELRTPLNAILGFGQLLEMGKKDFNEKQKSNINEIIMAGDHLLNLINDVLDLAKIESGKLEIFMEDVHFSDVLTQCINLIRPVATVQNIKLIDNTDINTHIVMADGTRLKQVLLNLLSNAVKYNQDNGHVILESEITDKQQLRIYIRDTGKGMTEKDIEKIFLPFERLDVTKNVDGVGIGLVITKYLIEHMSGSIGVESSLGEGSSFWIEIALANKA